MTKNEVVLQLTLKLLENFEYKTEGYGGTSSDEHIERCSKIASEIFNNIYKNIEC